jgi:thioredoxin-related protein
LASRGRAFRFKSSSVSCIPYAEKGASGGRSFSATPSKPTNSGLFAAIPHAYFFDMRSIEQDSNFIVNFTEHQNTQVMKKLFVIFIGAFILAANTKDEGLNIGDAAPLTELRMEGIDGQQYTLKTLKQEKGVLVIFSCNTCPYVLGWEDTYPELGILAKKFNMGMVLVNSNEAFRDDQDSREQMEAHAAEMGYNCPYVIDENHQLADAFGAQTTPHVFLFDGSMKLVYKGSINDKYERKDKTADKMYLTEAMSALASGKPITNPSTRQIGCSIKRIKK